MELQLKYNSQIHHMPAAVLLRGADPQNWLKQISNLDVRINELDCYIIPASLNSVKAAGLFVIFKKGTSIKNTGLFEPYTCITKQLYIPCNSTLFPQVDDIELSALLLYGIQVFHPAIGLIGFEESDKILLPELCIFSEPENTDWSFANPGIDSKPLFEKIIVQPASATEIIDDLKQHINPQALKNIPVRAEEKTTFLDKVLNVIKTIFFSILLGMITLFDKLFSSAEGRVSTTSNSTAGNGKGGVLKQIENWLNQNLEDLQKKRNDEIQRLLNLFEHDINEALQYAIPLNSPYLNRGSQTSSSKLFKRLPNFNLSNLGGGTAVDGWDVGSNYNGLRTRYLKAAQTEIEQKDFKKAAYIYAHLLGDYNNAANVLEQGNLHREAAALYKDHLKNTAAAARCLENGGLYLEAIDLFKDLNQDEKIGDLYSILKQKDNAAFYFENSITSKIDNNDYLDAARIIDEKLVQEERARQILLSGWKNSYQHEACLKKYFDLGNKKESFSLENNLQEIYRHHTPANKKIPFLHVLEYLNKKITDSSLLSTTQEIAYEIIHDEAEKGNAAALHNLKLFLPGDKLIASDTSRYNSNNNLSKKSSGLPSQILLDKSIKWVTTVWHRNQFLIFGFKRNRLQLARINWYGNKEYFSWDAIDKSQPHLIIVASPYYSNYILVHSTATIGIAKRTLEKNKYFNEALNIDCPIWLHNGSGQFVIDSDNIICRLVISEGAMTLHKYTIRGRLLESVNCLFDGDSHVLGKIYSNPYFVLYEGYIYSYIRTHFFTISPDGEAKDINFETGIHNFCASNQMSEFHIVIHTNKGCLLCKPNKGELNFNASFFAVKLIPIAMVFISATVFVISEKLKASVFEIFNDEPLLIYEAIAFFPIVGILPGADRNTFGTVEENGVINVYTFTLNSML